MKSNYSYWLVSLPLGKVDKEIDKEVSFSQRFRGDKVDYEDSQYIIISDGLILNSEEIKATYNVSSITEYYLQKVRGGKFPDDLIGPFNVFIYDKINSKGFSFGNQTGDSSVFYYYDKRASHIILSNNYNKIADRLSDKQLDEMAAHCLITYGFYVDDITIIKGLKRVQAGQYIELDSNKFYVKQYHHFDFMKKVDMTLDDSIEQLDVLFRKSISRCFNKDREYGYNNHLVSLSGGIDSRMVNFVAKDLGFDNINNYTFGQSSSDEVRYAFIIGKYLKNPIYYRSTDDNSYFFDIEKLVRELWGMCYYASNHCNSQFNNMINYDNVGLIHTGQIGDVVLSSCVADNSTNVDLNLGRNSHLLELRYKAKEDINNMEEFFIYGRAAQGALATSYSTSPYTYIVSPFLDKDLIEYCAKIPYTIRRDHRLYWAWIDRKYPAAGKFMSTRNRAEQNISLRDNVVLHLRGIQARFKRIREYLFRTNSCNHMNPYQFWYETNPRLRNFIETYFVENIELVNNYPQLQIETRKLFSQGNAFEKLMAISMLATVKSYLY